MLFSQTNIFMFSGGPVVIYEDNVFEEKYGRFLLIGTVHGAFFDCSNDLPGRMSTVYFTRTRFNK